MNKVFALTLAIALLCVSEPIFAQEQTASQQPSAEELEKLKAERERNAFRLLDQVIDEAQSLRLTENRVRVQINAADMLWDNNQGRARSLFMMAADGVVELSQTPATTPNRRPAVGNNMNFVEAGPRNMRSFQLRQELVLAAAHHDAPLAYQLLAATKPPIPIQNTADQRGPREQINSEESLEQTLLGRIAALDPKLAAQNAEQMLEKGQFPRTLSEVINQLRRQDAEAADKLADKTVKRLQSANILANNEASTLLQALLNPGPRQSAGQNAEQSTTSRRTPVLEQSAYVELLSSAVDAVLKVSPANQTTQRGRVLPRRAQVTPGNLRANVSISLTQTEIEQDNARSLLVGIQPALATIEQYLPAKAPLIRQKMSEWIVNSGNMSLAQTVNSLQGNATTTDALIQAAANAPQQLQSRLYQQAAFKALEEGDSDRARQIATDHLQSNVRDVVMQRIDFRELTKKAEGARIEEIKQAVSRLQSDNEKIELLIQVARQAEKTNSKLAVQLLEEARQITNRRATGYQHFEQQLKVARAFATLDPARSFEVLEPGINHLNELLSAASVLSGFEVNMFREGEMSIQSGNGLTSTINRYGQELALLARDDFERSETLAGRFQFAEPRIIARLAIIKGLLDVKPPEPVPGVPTLRGGNVIIRQD